MSIHVTLHPASMWECPGCRATNFTEGVPAEVTNEEAEQYAENFGGEPRDYQTGEWFTITEDVTCGNCHKTYQVGANWFSNYHDD